MADTADSRQALGVLTYLSLALHVLPYLLDEHWGIAKPFQTGTVPQLRTSGYEIPLNFLRSGSKLIDLCEFSLINYACAVKYVGVQIFLYVPPNTSYSTLLPLPHFCLLGTYRRLVSGCPDCLSASSFEPLTHMQFGLEPDSTSCIATYNYLYYLLLYLIFLHHHHHHTTMDSGSCHHGAIKTAYQQNSTDTIVYEHEFTNSPHNFCCRS